jgi:putative sugar O-methyltransferase
MTRTSISDLDDPFLNDIRSAVENEDAFGRFKRLQSIAGAIEGVNAKQGAEYRDIVLRQTPDLLNHLDKFRSNDTIGSPVTAPYPEGQMSPTTWRYIKVLSDLHMLFGSLEGWDVAEIGVGYGGQCKIINDVDRVAHYTMYDLEPVQRLAQKYLRHAQSPVIDHLSLPDFRRLGHEEAKTFDLAISNWAFSECSRAMQDTYIAHVLRRSRRGYLTYNQISHFFGVDSYRKGDIIEALGFPAELMHEGLNIKVNEAMDNFVLHWHSQPHLGN